MHGNKNEKKKDFFTLVVVAIIIFLLLAGLASADKYMTENIVQIITDTGRGSGFLFANGVVLTARHVLEDANDVMIIYEDKKSEESNRILRDPRYDIALIKVKRRCPDLIRFSSYTPKLGETLYMHGYPYDFGLMRLSKGISASKRYDAPERYYKENGWNKFFLGDFTSSPGNSGSPVFNEKREVVGMLVAGYENLHIVLDAHIVYVFVRANGYKN